jgi:hypothetical protein
MKNLGPDGDSHAAGLPQCAAHLGQRRRSIEEELQPVIATSKPAFATGSRSAGALW